MSETLPKLPAGVPLRHGPAPTGTKLSALLCNQIWLLCLFLSPAKYDTTVAHVFHWKRP